jgi:nucleoid DNA-binding protein
MTRKELIKDLALHQDIAGNTEAAAERVLDFLLETVTTEVSKGNEVYLGQKFGGFSPAIQAARSGVANGVEYSTPAKQVIKFKPSAKLKETVAGN